MDRDLERNFGPQPIAAIMAERGLTAHDLVTASSEQITHKMVSRACRGRRLTMRVQDKIVRALNAAAQAQYGRASLFNY